MAKVNVETMPFDPADYVRSDEEAALYISDALQSGDPSEVAAAIGTVVRARGTTGFAKATGVSRAALYKGLSADGNPTLATVLAVLKELGMTLKAEPLAKAA